MRAGTPSARRRNGTDAWISTRKVHGGARLAIGSGIVMGGLAGDVWRVHQLQQGGPRCEWIRAAGRVCSQISAYSNTPTGKRRDTHELWIADTPAAFPDPCSNHCAVTPATARPCMFLIQKSHAQTNRPRRAQTPTARPAGQGRRPGCRGKRFRAQRALPTFRTLI